MNVHTILECVKANVLIVVFIVAMVAALVAMPLVTGKMNASIKDDTKKRAQKIEEIKRLTTSVDVPGVPDAGSVLVNDRFNKRYKEVTEILREDAEKVHAEALRHNQKSRGVFARSNFPIPQQNQEFKVPREFHTDMVEGYEALLEDVRAGSPPAEADVAEALLQVRRRFYVSIGRDVGDELTDEEQQELEKRLASKRLSAYFDGAGEVSMYLNRRTLNVPEFNQASAYPLGELYAWQWKFWIVDDLLRAFSSANDGSTNVLTAPVKRITMIDPYLPVTTSGSARGGGGNPGSFSAGNGGGFGNSNSGGGRGNDGGAPPAQAPNPQAATPTDFNASFTGRVTNPLYDVVMVDVSLVVSTQNLPAVLDAIARYNFMTVIDVRMRPADVYGDLQRGYRYGGEAVTELELTIETVWMREWAMEFMPEETRTALGIPARNNYAAGSSDEEDF
ncbi:MAG: hypothetical protein AAF432_09000 [Planctomycetota bacterium]